MVGRPCATGITSAGSNPCSAAQIVHCRSTEPIDSASTPSKSNRIAPHESLSIIRLYEMSGLSPEPAGDPEHQRQENTENDAGNDWKIEGRISSAINDISRHAAER